MTMTLFLLRPRLYRVIITNIKSTKNTAVPAAVKNESTRKSIAKKNSKKRSSKSRKREDDVSDDSSSRNDKSEDDNSDYSRSRHKRRKKEKKQRRKKRQRRDTADETLSSDDNDVVTSTVERNGSSHGHILTQALCHLFTLRPVFAEELPILLIRLAGGSAFDLGQMNDNVAATALEGVLECLKEFGVQRNDQTREWTFQAPPGLRDERALLRVIRSLLDDVGITMQAVGAYETSKKEDEMNNKNQNANDHESTAKGPSSTVRNENHSAENTKIIDRIKHLTSEVILKYQSKDAELGSQFASLCQTIATGESISIDGLPDETLKASLEEIFVACGLEKSEMADGDDDDDEEGNDDEADDDDDDGGPTMGYCLPEGDGDIGEAIQLRLAAVMEACRNPQKRVLGPMRPTQQEASITYNSEDEEEGPALPGQERRRPRGPALPDHVLKAQAEHRELELKATAAGISIPKTDAGGREEWMIVPGKFDFMSNIKSGQPMKSRGFENKKTRGGERGGEEEARPIHPAIQAEMDAIRQAHEDARGPSLMDQHRSKIIEQKRLEEEERRNSNNKGQGWKWSRDKDLDAGRKVDKDALHMVLGGAASNLKTKFHGSFH